MLLEPMNRAEWLESRKIGIGGSDAGVILGKNKYKTNVQLWEEKTGLTEPEDISDKPAVIFGKTAEAPLRELFKLDFPQYRVEYSEFRMYVNDRYPFIFATLDGELTDRDDGSRGILEIKTTTIQNSAQWDEWEDRVPESYYAQLLHQLAATEWDFALLRAYIRYYRDDVLKISIRHYRIDRCEVGDEIEYLIGREADFWHHVETKTRPALILPEIGV